MRGRESFLGSRPEIFRATRPDIRPAWGAALRGDLGPGGVDACRERPRLTGPQPEQAIAGVEGITRASPRFETDEVAAGERPHHPVAHLRRAADRDAST